MRRLSTNYQVLPIWIYLWLIIFALILILSLVRPDGNAATIVKLGGIVLCLFYVAITFPHDYLLLAAMFATCVADIILANNNFEPIGIIIFLITQLLHSLRLGGNRKTIIIYSAISLVLLIIDYLFQFIPVLFVAAALYGIALISNIVLSAKWYKNSNHNPQAAMAVAGFLMFFFCDSCTVISFLSSHEIDILPMFLYAPANFFVWLFYYPSQILIANTGKYDTIRSKGR